jgi:hypothetical protein
MEIIMNVVKIVFIAVNLVVATAIIANGEIRMHRLQKERRHKAAQAEMQSWRNDPNTINAANDLVVVA